jgi:hypothetical protein
MEDVRVVVLTDIKVVVFRKKTVDMSLFWKMALFRKKAVDNGYEGGCV